MIGKWVLSEAVSVRVITNDHPPSLRRHVAAHSGYSMQIPGVEDMGKWKLHVLSFKTVNVR